MIIAMRPKFGTKGGGVTVGVMAGEDVGVGGTGVKVAVGEGTGDGVTVGNGVAVQAVNNINPRPRMPNRFIESSFEKTFPSEPCEGWIVQDTNTDESFARLIVIAAFGVL
jgi:hypothetical protein